jgi:TolA-binding protein
MIRRFIVVAAAAIVGAATVFVHAQQSSDEDIARRRLESGRVFARQGKFTEAITDFRAVAETYPTTSVADDALLEIAKYYIDVVGDFREASVSVDAILKKYPSSNSAPDAINLAGRLALTHSRQSADLDAAMAQFDRVPRLFPASDAVPTALLLAGETLWYGKRYEDAIVELGRVEAEYPTDPAAAGAYLAAGLTRLPLGDPIAAMEELQQVRDRFPTSPEAPLALAHTTLLHRLYVRAKNGPAYSLSTESAGPPKLENVVGLAMTAKNGIYWANETTVGIVSPATAEKPPGVTKARGLVVDSVGALVAIDTGMIQPQNGKAVVFPITKQNGEQVLLGKVTSAVELSNGDWLVMDEGEKVIHRFNRLGVYIGVFAQTKASHLAVNATDEVAAIDRDQKCIALFDGSGKPSGRIPLKGAAYDLQNPEDLTYDDFGHLYVLDRAAIAVFSPYPSAPGATASAASAPAAKPSGKAAVPDNPYRLLTFYTEAEKAPGAFRKATSFVVDRSGGIYLYDENAKRIMVYR